MTFDYPIMLTGFIIFIPIFIFEIISRKKRQKLPIKLEKKLRISSVFFRLFLACTIIAMSCPRWGMGYAPSEYRRGLDVVFAIDVSRSMDIRDERSLSQTTGEQSRLERGLAIAQESISSVTGARFAAAIGRGRGYLAVPLSHNSEAILVFLESIDGSSMTGRSTNLEALVDAAANAFQSSSPARKVIVLISDGESHAGILRNALNDCVREGIIVNTVAVGSDEGRRIPARLNDAESQSVISRRDAAVMRSAAERTGGIYIDGGREDAAFVLSTHLLSLAQATEFAGSKKEPKQRRTLFIILALVFYAASKFVTRNFSAQSAGMRTSVLLAVLIVFSSCSEGKLLLLEANYLNSRGRYDEALVPYVKALSHEDAAPYAEYGLGLLFYSLDELETALNHYSNSQKILETLLRRESNAERSRPLMHRELRYRNYYNSGIVFFEDGDFNSAADSFKKALRIDPGRIDAKRNLELSLMSISMENNTQNRTDVRQEQREILFEYLRQEEQQKWKSREWTAEEDYSGMDW
jgi:Ca-activated chloride channel family protein